jgi:multiple sugar transport system ATP-binding protein/alpha-glucoside transport system ATP-binding protein
MAHLKLTDVSKSFGTHPVLHSINLDIASGEFVVFVGPSGCGKSTLLRLIAGLDEVTSGTLEIDGRTVTHLPPKDRGIAMVFQSYALYPHMTVYQNMAFGLTLGPTMAKGEIDRRVRAAAEMLQITPYLERLPKELSGGQRQRVAIGRAITRDPKVFLFDEPLSNLDAALRVATRIEIAALAERMPDTTMIYVTHDQIEAMTLADRIVVLNEGRIEQVGTPLDLYLRPANLFVARFIGSPSMNIVPAAIAAHAAGATARPTGGAEVEVADARPAADGAGFLGVRPEDLAEAGAAAALFNGRVTLTEPLGEVTLVYVDIGGEAPIVAKLPGRAEIGRGDTLALAARPGTVHLFDADGRAVPRQDA